MRGGGDIREMPLAIIKKAGIRPAERSHQQVQVAISIEIGKGGAGGRLIGAGDAGTGGDVLKCPVPPVAIQRIAPLFVAEIKVTKPVAVVISGGQPGTVHQILALHDALD